MTEYAVTFCVKVTVPDFDAEDQTAALAQLKEDVLTRFPNNWVVEEITESN
jgi:hypothetical protein